MARKRQFPPSVDPGLPHEPPCPKGWERKSLGDILSVVERPVELMDEVEYQLVNAQRNRGGIASRERLQGKQIRVKTQFEVKAGDFLISKRQIVHGACGVVPSQLDKAIVSNEYVVLHPKEGLRLDYLSNLPHTNYLQRTFFHSSVGVDVEKMVFRLGAWLKFSLPIPPIIEQRKIASILSAVDDSIQKAEAVMERLREVQKTIMGQILSCGLQGKCHRRTSVPASWTLGRLRGVREIPETWTLVKLTTVAKLESGHTPSRNNPEYWNGGIPWVSLHDSKRLDVPEILETSQSISRLGLENSSARLLPKGTVVFSRTATVGKSTVIGREMATSQDFANYICGKRIHNRYLMHLFRHMDEEWTRLMAGSTHQTIYMPVFRELQILLPPIEEQRQIAEVGDLTEECLASEKHVLDILTSVKPALLQSLLSGKIRVQSSETSS